MCFDEKVVLRMSDRKPLSVVLELLDLLECRRMRMLYGVVLEYYNISLLLM
jgi:hypothetical protein